MDSKIYYLSTCSTCKRILGELKKFNFRKQDIRSEPLTEAQLDEMRELAGSYEALFSRRSQSFRKRNLQSSTLSENDYKKLILEDYTFLKRPVIIAGKAIFAGNSPKEIKAAAEALSE